MPGAWRLALNPICMWFPFFTSRGLPCQHGAVIHEASAAQPQHTVGAGGQFQIVRDQYERGIQFGVHLKYEVHDSAGGFGVEIPCRLVGEKDLRPVDKRARQCDTLLLAAAELRRVMVETIAKPDSRQQLFRLMNGAAFAAQFERNHYVLQRREAGQELEVLEDESGVLVAQERALVFVQLVQYRSIKNHRSAGWQVQTGAKSEQRGFAAAGRTDDRAGFTARQSETDIIQYRQRPVAAGINTRKMPCLQNDLRTFAAFLSHGTTLTCPAKFRAGNLTGGKLIFESAGSTGAGPRRSGEWPCQAGRLRTGSESTIQTGDRGKAWYQFRVPKKLQSFADSHCIKSNRAANALMPSCGRALWAVYFSCLLCALPILCAEAGHKTIVFLGDSIAAGNGVDPSEAFPSLVQRRIEERQLPYDVVNAGVSGDTTAGGVRRMPWLLKRRIDVLVIELGGNDGLRGIAPEETRANLENIIRLAREKYPAVRIVIAGMQMPQNMGAEYNRKFREVFAAVAKEKKTELIPFLLEGVGGKPELNQADRIHPNPEGHRIVANNVWSVLAPMLMAAQNG